jgi:pimeloyl-ACP methyl ester carboxylesterase
MQSSPTSLLTAENCQAESPGIGSSLNDPVACDFCRAPLIDHLSRVDSSTDPVAPAPVPEFDADLFRIPVGPGAIHVERYGHGGTPVVLLHGFGTTSFLWRNVAPELARRHHTAFAIDLFGHGESDRPFDADFGIAAQSEYIERALTALRVTSATVVGVDLGAAIALRLAATRRERVERLVLINPLAFDDVPGGDVRSLQRNTARFAISITRGLFGVAPLLVPLLEQSVADPAHMPPRLVARYLAPFIGADGVNHLLALARAIRSEEMEEIDLGDVRAPALVVWGEHDEWLDRKTASRLKLALPFGEIRTLPNVGRLVPEEMPHALAEMVNEFAANGRAEVEAPA